MAVIAVNTIHNHAMTTTTTIITIITTITISTMATIADITITEIIIADFEWHA
jgi:hypothetical protein